MKKALILGISGQDGSYLAEALLQEGVAVTGTSTSTSVDHLWRLRDARAFGARHSVPLDVVACNFLADPFQIQKIIADLLPDEIYDLSGQSSVGESFKRPLETLFLNGHFMLYVLEAVRNFSPHTKIVFVGSSEMFGNAAELPLQFSTPLNPVSPYGLGKMFGYQTVQYWRQHFGVHASLAVLFNHESPRRDDRFVTRKIILGALDIVSNKTKVLQLGNLNIERDWGYAPEYMEGLVKLMRLPLPNDCMIATGESHSLREFVTLVFQKFGLNSSDHVVESVTEARPSEIFKNLGDTRITDRLLGWKPTTRFPELIEILVQSELMKRAK